MKKIMHVTQSKNGGVAKYIKILLKYMNSDEFENILVYSSEYEDEKKYFEDVVNCFEVIDMCREINLVKDIKAILQLRKLVKKHNPDLIYLHSSKAGAIGRILRIMIKKPIIYNPHGWAFNMKVSNKKINVYKFIEKLLSSMCDKIIAISEEELKSALNNKICKDDKIQLIYNGIDIDEYDKNINLNNNYKESLGVSSEKVLIGMVGRISKQKAPDIFVELANNLLKNNPNLMFVIVGDGEDRKAIETQIEKYNIKKNFIITGWVEDTYKYIQAFDIAILLSRWEGFGLAIAEYMVCKKPIIATRIDGIPNLINDNLNGILVEPNNIVEAELAIKKLLSDKRLCEQLSINANVKVRKLFDIKRVAFEHEQLINNILK